ncbi:tRNA-dihydrouridine synthase family protein [Sulfuriroseicoccus oceanibius]|uniref:tRNA-dihydrouridine synthase family protein n=2 Tax=Sulfuriroseicoccus oceanibius TaxID=2707525 RepID=A0A6B3L291_9BACT|nr:tRNA-dihydrouridine synthase family protein [Sulfuriroseicoccus oceanibius]
MIPDFPSDRPVLALAPMQDITDRAFMRVISRLGGPDYYVTEYFRVHRDSHLEKHILAAVTDNQTGRPLFAQMIGMDIPEMVRTARQLLELPVAGIDLNLGCPAPVVCRKDAGGGLLRLPEHTDRLIGTLRESINGKFTVKTRIGYHSEEEFPALLEIFRKHGIDALTIHGRTVTERYQSPVHTDCVKAAVDALDCPVIANGNVVNACSGLEYIQRTGAAGLMIGRGGIRNPWLFDQLRAAFAGRPIPKPTHRDLREYILALHAELEAVGRPPTPERIIHRLKKFLVFIAQGLDPDFDYRIRRVSTKEELLACCDLHLDHDTPLPDLPPENSKLFCGFSDLLPPNRG